MDAAFAKDFINLQSEIGSMPKDKSGYGYKYTDLDTIISALKPLCKKHNIAFTQVLHTDNEGRTGINTQIIHASGAQFGSFVVIPEIQVGKANNAQNIGAAITYLKRYALAAAFGISSDEDIDCSSQAMEKNGVTSAKATPNKSNNATNEKAHVNNNSTTTNKNFSALPQIKLYTKEQADELAGLMGKTYDNGEPIFNEADKNIYRESLFNGDAANAITKAKEEIKKRMAGDF